MQRFRMLHTLKSLLVDIGAGSDVLEAVTGDRRPLTPRAFAASREVMTVPPETPRLPQSWGQQGAGCPQHSRTTDRGGPRGHQLSDPL